MSAEILLQTLTQHGVELWVENDRLRYRAARAALTPELLAQMRHHKSALLRLVQDQARSTHSEHAHDHMDAPLSYGQRGIWFLCKDAPDSTAYNISFACRLVSAVDVPALKAAFQALINRHPSLRTTFPLHKGEPVQRVSPHQIVCFEQIDTSGWTPEQLVSHVYQTYQQPFDLEQGPLVRVHLFRPLSASVPFSSGHVLLLTMHHINHDGWSLWLLLDELWELYAAQRSGHPARLPALEANYLDFSAWQNTYVQTADGRRSLAYWQQRLAGQLPVLDLPTDRARPAVRSNRGATVPFCLDAGLTRRINARAQAEGVTVYMFLLAAFQVLLHRYSGQDDIIVGSPISGRGQAAFRHVVGYCINQVALRADLSGQPSFRSFLDQVCQRTLEALDHQDYPFTRLVDHLQPPRDPSRSPVFQVSFAVQQPQQFEAVSDLFVAVEMGLEIAPNTRINWGGLTLAPFIIKQQRAWFDLTVQIMEVRDVLAGSFSYSTDLFEDATIQRMVRHYQTLLGSILNQLEQDTDQDQQDQPLLPISRLPLLDAAEQQALLCWQPYQESSRAVDQQLDLPPAHCLSQQFAEQAERCPDAVALVWHESCLTYGMLHARSNRLAHYLCRSGVGREGRESLVGICADRSLEMIVGMLAILKAGGAYVPLDPSYPPQRLRMLIHDAGVQLVLTTQRFAERFRPADLPHVRQIVVDTEAAQIAAERSDNVPVSTLPDNLAYVIYTSGSTGTPKGVQVSHANVARLFTATQAWYACTSRDVWTLFHSAAFDFSVWEMWGALLHGARLVLVPYETSRSPEDFFALLGEQQVTVLNQTPSAFYHLAQVATRPAAQPAPPRLSLRLVIFGGEALDVQRLQPWFTRSGDRPQLVNMYGITETTVHVTYRPLPATDATLRSSRIGSPIPDLSVYVLDPHCAVVPLGIPGELYIGGAGITRGYLNRPGLTADRFGPDPFGAQPGARLYRSGDVARRLPGQTGDELEYVGRIDHQIQLRGFRIEPAEIEAALNQHPAVLASHVVARPEADERFRLLAYVVPDSQTASPVVRRLQLEKRHALAADTWYTLPNGLTIAHLNPAETDFVYAEIFERRVYLKHGIQIQDGACIFDVGANIGLFPLFLAHTGKRVKVYAFEPVPPVFARLRTNCEVYNVDAELFQCAVGRTTGQVQFTYYPNASVLSGRFADTAQETQLVKAYLLRQAQPGGEQSAGQARMDRLVSELLAERLHSQDIVCELRPVSDVIAEHNVQRIDLLKIDVEKSEMEVLAGISAEDWPKIQQLIVEVHDLNGRLHAVEQLLREQGFHLTVEQDGQLTHTELFSVYATRRLRSAPPPSVPLAPPPQATWSSPTTLIQDVRRQVKETLPAYMLPATYVMLDALPLTPNGKIDRRAFPAPEAEQPPAPADFVAPRTATEHTLATIWAQVLHLKHVSITANFFELGGDSILSILVASRVQEAGLRMVSRHLFQHQTIADLALALEAESSVRASSAEQAHAQVHAQVPAQVPAQVHAQVPAQVPAVVAGPVPLTPIQHWFFAQQLADPHHFNQSVCLEFASPVNLHTLRHALAVLLHQHDVFQLFFTPPAQQAGQSPDATAAHTWTQEYAATQLSVTVPEYDLSSLSAASQLRAAGQLADRLQASLELSQPPLLRAAFIRFGPDRPDQLLLILHHLIVDAVSWRVISQELLRAVQAADSHSSGSSQDPLTPSKTPFQAWSRQLQDFAQSSQLDADRDYWLAQARTQIQPLPVDWHYSVDTLPLINTEAAGVSLSLSLDPADSQALLRQVPSAYNVRINVVLLAALLRAYTNWSGDTQLWIDLEGHGREELLEAVDLSHTVGWFTTIFPVLLRPPASPAASLQASSQSVAELLHAVKTQLDQIPRRGLSYGLLRYITGLAQLQSASTPQLSFNYLGRLDTHLASVVHGGAGRNIGPANQRFHLLDIAVFVGRRQHQGHNHPSQQDDQLHIRWTYSRNIHRPESIQRLAQGYCTALRDMLASCQVSANTPLAPQSGPSPVTPAPTSDTFPLSGLDSGQLRKLSRLLDKGRQS